MKQKIYAINREISWLSFNERVLQEAADSTVPLVERMRFLGIFSNNLDEFFKVRVASIKKMSDIAYTKTPEGEDPRKILQKIQERVIGLQSKFLSIFMDLIHDFEKEKIYIIDEEEINEVQAKYIDDYFDDKILPYLSPIIISNVKEFPNLKDKLIYFAIKLSNSENTAIPVEYAIIEIPSHIVNRIIVLPQENEKKYIILLDDAIRYCLKDLFAIFNFNQFEAYTIKLTRDAELDIDNDLSKSFLEKISKSVSERIKGQPVRFLYDEAMPNDLLDFLLKKLSLTNYDNLIPGSRYHNFKDFMNFPNIGGPHLEYSPSPSLDHYKLKRHASIFRITEEQDIMLHYPYQKFAHFIDFLREAAMDPKVTHIYITLYRIAKDSQVINALINAARNGKNVTIVIELQARFDEESNIYWSKTLEEEGVNILFGIKGLKVHAKLVLVVRKDKNKTQKFGLISTGNFHEKNAKVYTDIALITCDKRITSEIEKIFSFMDNTYKNYTYKHLMVSPLFMRNRLTKLIDNEIQNARVGKDAYIILKINNLVDNVMINKLYEANKAGVKIKLIVRGICGIRVGVPGLSENIEAISIVDKFLEHSRIFIFCNNNKELYFISSADLMTRNLDHRVEVACPIFDPKLKKLLKKIIDFQMNDNVKARFLTEHEENEYKRNDKPKLKSQEVIYQHYTRKLLNINTPLV